LGEASFLRNLLKKQFNAYQNALLFSCPGI
jgi:hypothetical protein